MTREKIKNLRELIDLMLDKCILADSRTKVFKRLEEVCNLAIKALEQETCIDAQECYEDLCEYFGDAKDILKSRKDFKAWLERIKWHVHKAEELYEKYEYKQEPCEDNRLYIKVYADLEPQEKAEKLYQICEEDELKEVYKELGEYCEIEPCDDCISRQYLLDNCVVDKVTMPYVPISKIQEAPPVTPQPKMGQWIRVDKDKLRCSKCDVIHFIAQYPQGKIAWCPNCGAKMYEPQESEKVNCKSTKCNNCINHNYCDYEPK